MKTIKARLSWQRLAALGILLLLLPVAMLYAMPAPPPATVSFDYSSWTFSESDGFATVTVTMNGTPTDVVYVTVSTTSGGTATAGVDYQPASQLLVWQPSEAGISKDLTFQIIDKYTIQPTVTVNVVLTDLSSNASFASDPTAVVNIMCDNGQCSSNGTRK